MLKFLLFLATASSVWAQCVSPTTILGTDVVSASRSVINANFTNLSDCKAPKASPTLTGTVTVTGLGTGALKATSGAIGLVTGTAGHCVHVDGSASACTTGNVTSVGLAGTANQITVTGTSPITSSGSFTLSIPTNPTLPGTTTGSFSGPLAGNASTATALASNPTDCSANQYATSIGANGDLGCASITSGQVSGIPHPFVAVFDGGGNPLTTSQTAYFPLPYGCTIQAYTIWVDTGTITMKLWKVATGGTALPTVANVISTSGWAVASGQKLRSTTLSDLTTTTVTANDFGAATITAVSGATQAGLTVECQ